MDRIIASDPENPNHYLKRGDICLKAGDVAEAVGSYLSAAWYLNRDGFMKKALAVYKMVLRFDPDNDEAVHASSRIMMELETPKQAASKVQWTEVFQGETSREAVSGAAADSGLGAEGRSETGKTGMPGAEDTPLIPGYDQPAEASRVGAETGREVVPEFPPPFSDVMTEILEGAEMKRYSIGEKVIEEGDTGESVYIIRSGNAAVFGHFSGKEIRLSTLGAGDFFGEVAFLTGRTRTATVVAEGDLEVYEINRVLLDRLIEKTPGILIYLNEIYLKRVSSTISRVKAG